MRGQIQFREKLQLTFTLIGAGANGSNFFRGLCHDLRTHLNSTSRPKNYYHDPEPVFRLHQIMLCDGDLVDEKNLGNQIFEKDEVGTPKVVALAERYAEHYDLEVLRYPHYIGDASELSKLVPKIRPQQGILHLPVLVGLVDNVRP